MPRNKTGTKSITAKLAFLKAVRADPGLSAPAKCVMSALVLDFYNNESGRCNPSVSTIAESIGRTTRAVIPVIQELKASGWVEVVTTKGGASTNSNQYRFDFSRRLGGDGIDTTPDDGRGEVFFTPSDGARGEEHFSAGVKQTVGRGEEPFQRTSLEPLSSSLRRMEGDIDVDPQGRRSASVDAPPVEAEPSSGFEEFWQQYPRREGEDGARREFERRAAAGVDPRAMISGAMRYAAAVMGKPDDFVMMPVNWLRDGRWKDTPKAPQLNDARHDSRSRRNRTPLDIAAEYAAKREGR
ncbi:helix-turn-helix domain-containing protein [Bradyrhizobium sp. USDA 4508]